MNTYQEYTSNFFVDKLEQIQQKTRKLIRKLVETVVESNFEETNHLFQESKAMAYSIQGYMEGLELADKEKDMLMHAGYNTALLDVMQLYMEKLYAQEEIQKVKTSYRDMILCVLRKRGTLLHKDLAAELVVSASGLTAIIKQMNATSVKLVNVEEVSKFKLYSLTPVARQYIEKYMPQSPTDYTHDSRDYHSVIGQEKMEMKGKRFGELGSNILSFQQRKYDRITLNERRSSKQPVRQKFNSSIHTFNRVKQA